MAEWIVRVDYDTESRSWYVHDSDVPGLSTGGETLEELEAKLPELISDLLELNADLFVDQSRLQGPHSYRLIAHHEFRRSIAA